IREDRRGGDSWALTPRWPKVRARARPQPALMGYGLLSSRQSGTRNINRFAPPPPRARMVRDELSDRMLQLRERCEDSDRRACVRLGILIGENQERRAAWRREHPDVFFYERD